MKIAICDDEIIIINMLKSIIETYLTQQKNEFKIMTFQAGTQLLQSVINFDVIFLDINMQDMDGICVGKELRKENRTCKIIIIASSEKRYREAFEINAFRFVTKPFKQKEIEKILDMILYSLRGMEKINLYWNRNLYEIAQYKIEYIWTFDSYAEFFLGDKIFRKNVSLRELEQTLDSILFFRINRKIIVNITYIKAYKDGTIKIGREIFKVARRKKKEFEKIYVEYDLMFS